jgi:hypothetical protein
VRDQVAHEAGLAGLATNDTRRARAHPAEAKPRDRTVALELEALMLAEQNWPTEAGGTSQVGWGSTTPSLLQQLMIPGRAKSI